MVGRFAGSAAGARSLRIEMVVPALERAGLEMVVASLHRSLTGLGHSVGVTCIERTGSLGDEMASRGARITVVPTPGLRTNAFPKDLAAWFRESRPDVVHSHSGSWLKAVRAGRMAQVPTVYTLHGIWPEPPWYIPVYSRLAATQTDRIVAVSTSLREHLTGALGIRSDQVEVIENGIDTDLFSPGDRSDSLRGELGIDPNAAVIGTVGRLHPVKNHTLLIDAFARVHERDPRTALLIVGEGALRGSLEERVRSLGLERVVHLPGESMDVVRYYREFDLFVLSSVIEGTSISGLEAMSCGVCPVATAVGGNPALLGHGRHGVLVPPGDPVAMADALLALLADPSKRKSLGAAARVNVVTHHDETAVAKKYLAAYATAIRMRGGKRSARS